MDNFGGYIALVSYKDKWIILSYIALAPYKDKWIIWGYIALATQFESNVADTEMYDDII